MAAGDLITVDYQLELNATLFGALTTFVIDEPGIKGLGSPTVKSADTSFDGRDGSRGAPDFLDVRVITIPIDINEATAEAAMNSLAVLNTAWQPARDGVDVELHLQLPGFGHVFFLGRARGADETLTEVQVGWIPVLCRFDALDPTIYAA